ISSQLSRALDQPRIFAVGIGADADQRILEGYATRTDGLFRRVASASDLLPALADVSRVIAGTFVAEGEEIAVFPGDRELKIFVARGAREAPLRLEGPQTIRLEGNESVFSALIGEVEIYSFDTSPPPGLYHLRPASSQSRVLTEKRAAFRVALDPPATARTNVPLRLTARIVPLVSGIELPT